MKDTVISNTSPLKLAIQSDIEGGLCFWVFSNQSSFSTHHLFSHFYNVFNQIISKLNWKLQGHITTTKL